MADQLRRLPVEQVLRQLADHVTAHVAAGHGRPEDVRPALTPVIEHALPLEPGQQRGYGGQGERARGQQRLANLAAGGFAALPAHVQDRELKLGETKGFVHGSPRVVPASAGGRSAAMYRRRDWRNNSTLAGPWRQAPRVGDQPAGRVSGG